MSKQGLSNYLALKHTTITFYRWQEERYSVRLSVATVFDAWVRQYVEEIVNVDTVEWDIYDRWGIVNELLRGGFLVLAEEEGGTFLLRTKQEMMALVLAEEISSAPPVEDGTSARQTEPQTSVVNAQGMIHLPGGPITSGWANIVKGMMSGSITTDERGE